jgi:hypothetical protein
LSFLGLWIEEKADLQEQGLETEQGLRLSRSKGSL